MVLSEQEATRIEAQTRVRVDNYIESVKALDSISMLDFWSDSEDFVYAVDGRVLGGFEPWKTRMMDFVRNTSQVLYWKNENIHIKALADNAASYTMDFEVSTVSHEGDNSQVKGAWTYVFEKANGPWKVIHTNCTH